MTYTRALPGEEPVGSDSFLDDSYWRESIASTAAGSRIDSNCDDLDFRELADNLPTLCWLANADGYITWYNGRWHAYCGTTPEQMEGWGWQVVHDPNVLPEVLVRWRQSIATSEPFEMVFPLRGADGIFRPFLTRVVPIRDGEGTVKRWIGNNVDISAQVAAESDLVVSRDNLEHLNRAQAKAEDDLLVLNQELAHRLKNVLAVVQSVAQQTLRGADDVETASQALSARLVALGAASDVLTSGSWRMADLEDLAAGTLAPHGTIGDRIDIAGPTVLLKPQVTLALALAFHELATNAVKYGALSNDLGTISLSWSIRNGDREATLLLEWRERGGPLVKPPERTGFGTRLIDRSLRAYFNGRAETTYAPGGLVFVMEARLADAAVTSRNYDVGSE